MSLASYPVTGFGKGGMQRWKGVGGALGKEVCKTLGLNKRPINKRFLSLS
jgi:hypothetical protein